MRATSAKAAPASTASRRRPAPEEHEQRKQVQRDPLDRRERVVLHRQREVERREREGEAGDERGERAPREVASQQIHRAAGEHEARGRSARCRRRGPGRSPPKTSERSRSTRLQGVFGDLEPERRLELGIEGRVARPEVRVVEPAEVRRSRPSCRCRSRRSRRADGGRAARSRRRRRPCREPVHDERLRQRRARRLGEESCVAHKEALSAGGLDYHSRRSADDAIWWLRWSAPEAHLDDAPLDALGPVLLDWLRGSEGVRAGAFLAAVDSRPNGAALPLQRRLHPLSRVHPGTGTSRRCSRSPRSSLCRWEACRR